MPETTASLLIVDDEPSTRYSLSQIFSCKGHIVRIAEDGFSALGVIRANLPDVLLCDLNMPRMSGFELLSVVRRRFPQIYVIAMSGAFPGPVVPRGIAADAFYAEGSGLVALFQLVRDGIASQERALLATRTAPPVWVPSTGLLAIRASALERAIARQVMIGCPECLRPFPLEVGPKAEAEAQARAADCVHCSVRFDYAVVA